MNTTPVKIVETVLRDGHQSLAATRMRITDMVPVLEELDDMGYYALEAWGGATFDACLRFLDEDPWERLRTLKKHLPKTIWNARCVPLKKQAHTYRVLLFILSAPTIRTKTF